MTPHPLAPARHLVRATLRHAGMRMRECRPNPTKLAAACVGHSNVVLADIEMSGYFDARRGRIIVSRRCTDIAFVVAHELGHWTIRRLARMEMARVDEERLANDFALVLLRRTPWWATDADEREAWARREALLRAAPRAARSNTKETNA